MVILVVTLLILFPFASSVAGLVCQAFADPRGAGVATAAPMTAMKVRRSISVIGASLCCRDPSSRYDDEFPARMSPGEHLVRRGEFVETVGLAHRGADRTAVDNPRDFRQLGAVGTREGAVETCLAGAGSFDQKSDACRGLLGDRCRKTD